MPEKDLAAALRQAHVRNMFFAFILKGRDGKLIASACEIPLKEIEKAKKDLDGATAVTGTFFGPIGHITFQVAEPPLTSLDSLLPKVIKRDTGLTVRVEVQVEAPDR